MMTYLASKNSFKPDDKLFDFTVDERLLEKSLELTFKSTDGLSTIKKQINILFVRVRDIKTVDDRDNRPPQWAS